MKQSRRKSSNSRKQETDKTVYVLELDNSDYYVGYTAKNVDNLLKSFAQGGKRTPEWVKQHNNFKLIKTLPIGAVTQKFAQEYTSAYVVRMMAKVGYPHVRGGKFTLTDPDEHRKTVANQCRLGEIAYIEEVELQLESDSPFSETDIHF